MKLAELRGILQYVLQFREKTFVLALDGAVVADDNFATLLLDVALLLAVNIRVVLVHGAGRQIQALAADRGVEASDLDGAGVTDATTLDLAVTAATRLTHQILEGLSANDLRAACANVITAYPVGILQGVDHLFTGKVERVDADLIQSLLAQGVVPVIPPLGFDGEGRTYRLNSDRVAVAVAEQLKAIKLIFVTVQDGLVHRGQLIRQMLPDELRDLIRDAPDGFAPGLLSKATHAAAACEAGVPRVHVVNGTHDDGLLGEVFSNHGLGTLIHINEYEQIRPARKKDVRAIQMLTRQAVEADELVRRTRTTIERDLADYYIFEVDKNPVACVALHVYPEQHQGELACLYVSTAHENQGLGRKLIQFVEKRARDLRLDSLLVLSTQAFSYFQSKGGFVEGTPDDLPAARRERYEQSGRRSKVLVKNLAAPVD
jgi:amino-acid N-acetyltransferase